MKKQLTVVIAFINEGVELPITLGQIRKTAGNEVDIVLIDDGSDDGIDYAEIAETFSAKYVKHNRRQGSAPSKDEGVQLAQTPYILILDGHMRFYQTDWVEKIIGHIKKYPETLLCCRCKGILPTDTAWGEGAVVNFTKDVIFKISWLAGLPKPENATTLVIPCILGASYCCSKKLWNFLRGYEGLTYYGAEEQYLSIKAWMGAEGVRQIRDVVIGHRFSYTMQSNGKPKFTGNGHEILHNYMVIAYTLLSDILFKKCMKFWENHETEYAAAAEELEQEKHNLDELREYYKNNFPYPFRKFEQVNSKAWRHEELE